MEAEKNVVLQKTEIEMTPETRAGKNENLREVLSAEKPEQSKKVKKSKKLNSSKTSESRKKNPVKNAASQKRYVSAVKVFLTDEEKEEIQVRVGNFNSLSNYIRHHLGLPPNEVGRKRHFTKSALDLELDFAIDLEFDVEADAAAKISEETEKSPEAFGTEKNGEAGKAEIPEKTEKAGHFMRSGGQLNLWDVPNE